MSFCVGHYRKETATRILGNTHAYVFICNFMGSCALFCVAAEKQACLLTKSQPFYDLPESVTDLNNVPELPDQVSCCSVV